MDGQWGTEDGRCENVFNWSCDKIRTLLSEFRPLASTKRSMTTDTKLPHHTSRSRRICAHRVIDVGPDRFFVVLLRLSKTKQIRQKARQGGIRPGMLLGVIAPFISYVCNVHKLSQRVCTFSARLPSLHLRFVLDFQQEVHIFEITLHVLGSCATDV
jgi:hypothetical protein